MYSQTTRKTRKFQKFEDNHLQFDFQCKDLIGLTNYRPKIRWLYFTDDNAAILGSLHDVDEDSLFLRRPLGEGMELLSELENQYCKTKKLRICGLSRDQLIELSKTSLYPYEKEAKDAIEALNNTNTKTDNYFCADSGKYIYRYIYGWQKIQDFDPHLESSSYSNIRKSVNKAKREGLQFRSAKKQDLPELEKLYNTWFAQSEQKGKKISYKFQDMTDKPLFETYVVTDHDEKLLAWSTIYVKNKYASMPKRIALSDVSRPADFMDYNIFCLLNSRGVERVDRSVRLDEQLNNYKSKIMPMHTEEIFNVIYQHIYKPSASEPHAL